jgi:hypothetical protein
MRDVASRPRRPTWLNSRQDPRGRPAGTGRRPSPRVRLILALIVLATILRAVVWIGVLPAWQGPDEGAHYAYVERLANWSYPNVDDPNDHASAALTSSWAHTGYADFLQRNSNRPLTPTLRRALPPEPPNLSQDAPGAAYESGYPPLYYALLVPFYRLPGLDTATSRLYAVRFGSALLGGLLVLITFFLVRELVRDDVLALAGAALVGLPPMISQASAITNPDIGLAVAGTALALAALRAAIRGFTWRRIAAVGLLAIATAEMKVFGPAAAAVIAGPLLILPVLARRTRHMVLAALAFTTATAVGLFIASLVNSGQLSSPNLRFSAIYLWQFYLPRLPFMSVVFPAGSAFSDPVPAWWIWGQLGAGDFGWISTPIAIGYVKLAVVTAAVASLAAAAALVVRRHSMPREDLVLIGSCAVAVVLFVLALNAAEAATMIKAQGDSAAVFYGRLLQGRYLIPIAPLGVAAVLAGLRAWSRPVALAGAAVLLATWFVISIAGLDTILRFYAT